MSGRTQYRVYATPRNAKSTYAPEVEVTDRVLLTGLAEIVRSIDSSDYNVGVYTFNDVTLECDNSDGYFSDPSDSRSLFQFSRDLAKIRVVYYQNDVPTTTFRGLINDEATRNDLQTDTISFRVLGLNSAIRKTLVIPGTVTDGTSVRNAIFAILNREEITSVLSITLTDINPDQNGTVDLGTKLDNQNTADALNELLGVSNSVLVITSSDEIVVKSRAHDTVKDPLLLFGKGDLLLRENISSIADYNSGLQRLFNSIKVNDIEVSDNTSIVVYGARNKEFTIDWLTDLPNITALANRILREWKSQKIEFTVQIRTELAKDYDLLDRVSIDFPLVVHPAGRFLPFYEVAVYDDPDAPYPHISGSLAIMPELGFKIIEIREDPRAFITTLKLRQIGVTETDGLL